MKQDESHELARRYAHAFTNVFSADLSLNDIEHIEQAAEYLTSRRRTRFFLRLPAIDSSVKKQALDMICKRFSLPAAIDKLIDLLLKHKRSYLLHRVFLYLVEFYYANHAIETFTISSSQQLSPAHIDVIKNFLARKTGCTILYSYKIDKNLIAGIRLESKSFLWEYSIRKHLKRIQQLAI